MDAGIISKGDEPAFPIGKIGYKTALYLDARGVSYPEFECAVRDAEILILGCGGIGNHLAYSLSSLPIKKLILVDGDEVDETNLNRQFLFNRADIGTLKVEALKARLELLNPEIDIETVPEFVNAKNLQEIAGRTANPKLAVLSADSVGILQEVCPTLVANEIPFLNVGYLNDISVIGPFWTKQGDACPCCFGRLGIGKAGQAGLKLSQYFVDYEAPSCMVNNSFAGAMAMADLMSFWAGEKGEVQSRNKRVGINNLSFEKLEIPMEFDPECEVCAAGGVGQSE